MVRCNGRMHMSEYLVVNYSIWKNVDALSKWWKGTEAVFGLHFR